MVQALRRSHCEPCGDDRYPFCRANLTAATGESPAFEDLSELSGKKRGFREASSGGNYSVLVSRQENCESSSQVHDAGGMPASPIELQDFGQKELQRSGTRLRSGTEHGGDQHGLASPSGDSCDVPVYPTEDSRNGAAVSKNNKGLVDKGVLDEVGRMLVAEGQRQFTTTELLKETVFWHLSLCFMLTAVSGLFVAGEP